MMCQFHLLGHINSWAENEELQDNGNINQMQQRFLCEENEELFKLQSFHLKYYKIEAKNVMNVLIWVNEHDDD